MSDDKDVLMAFLLRNAKVERMRVISAIYFLLAGTEVVYVGKSIDLYARITAHSRGKAKKQFDNWAYIECHVADLNEWETRYINLLDPRENRAKSPSYKKPPHSDRYAHLPRFILHNGRLYEDIEVTDELRKAAADRLGDILAGDDLQCTENAHTYTESCPPNPTEAYANPPKTDALLV